jgi:hypothetical protein
MIPRHGRQVPDLGSGSDGYHRDKLAAAIIWSALLQIAMRLALC